MELTHARSARGAFFVHENVRTFRIAFWRRSAVEKSIRVSFDGNSPVESVHTHPESSDILHGRRKAPLALPAWVSPCLESAQGCESIEVGDYYFKRKNYRAAEDRYREALFYKDNDALATFHLAVCLEKNGPARRSAQGVRKLFEDTASRPQAEEARKAMERLKASAANLKSAHELKAKSAAATLSAPTRGVESVTGVA